MGNRYFSGRPAKDMTGKRFGRLVAVSYAARPPKRGQWVCQCDCGKTVKADTSHLNKGMTRSCGCLRDELAGSHRRTHGATNTPEYACWNHLKQRCTNPRNPAFAYYGGRGISVCDRWLQSFQHFLEDIGKRPHPNLTLDRIDNDGNYEPGNVRWATYAEQFNNQRPARPRKRTVPDHILQALRSSSTQNSH